MRGWLERHSRALHAALALAAAGAFAGSPWLAMARRLPREPDAANLAHVALGTAAALLTAAYLLHCTLGGRWRLYYPWLAGRFDGIGRDLAGLARGRAPTVEGGGLLATVEGLLLLAMLAAGWSGVGWLFAQGSAVALDWSDWHATLAWCAGALLALHLLGVLLHWIDFIRG